jgi:hypothetical protein
MHGQAPDPSSLMAGADPSRPLDAVFVNAPLRDYSVRPRVNDFTIPVLGMAYIATSAADSGYNVGILDAKAGPLISAGGRLSRWRRTRAARVSTDPAPRPAGPCLRGSGGRSDRPCPWKHGHPGLRARH